MNGLVRLAAAVPHLCLGNVEKKCLLLLSLFSDLLPFVVKFS